MDSPFEVAPPRADVIGASMYTHTDGRVHLSLCVSEFTDPFTDPNWIVGVSGAEWGFDVDGDGLWDYRVVTFHDGTTLTAGVFDALDRETCPRSLVDTAPTDFGIEVHPGFMVGVDASCLDYPSSVSWYAAFTYDTEFGTAVDVVPDGDAYAGPTRFSPERPALDRINAVKPVRLLDTRPGWPTADGRFAGLGTLRGGSEIQLPVVRRGGVSILAASVMLNVTAIGSSADGFLTVWPCGRPRPNASQVNFRLGQIVANSVLAEVGTNGSVCVYSPVDVEVVVDVNGWAALGASPNSVLPARLLDTRPAPVGATVDGRFAGVGRRQALSITEIPVVNRGGVPADASAVILNVTAVQPSTAGFLTIWSCDEPKPLASSVNYAAGAFVPNAVVAQIGSRGSICLYTLGDADVLIDVNGYVPASGTLVPTTPARLLETRVLTPPGLLDSRYFGIGRLAARSTTELVVAGRSVVPSDALAVVLNVTAISTSGAGFITVWPCGQPMPVASNLNTIGPAVANAVLAKVGVNGTVCIYTSNELDLAVDLNAFVPAPT